MINIKLRYNNNIKLQNKEFKYIYEFNKYLFIDFYCILQNKRD